MSPLQKKILATLGLLIGVTILVAIGILYYIGFFNSVTLSKQEKGPYKIVCLPHTGPYYQTAKTIQKVKDILQTTAIKAGEPCALFYDNPKNVPQNKLRSKGGVLVQQVISLKPPLQLEEIPARPVIVGKIKAHPAFAPIKVYPKLHKWLEQHHLKAGTPSLEIYHTNGWVECQLPIVQTDSLKQLQHP
ncbi:MAG: GyrI-like domain-containing protein [Calditrichaeota bacterium]|nr:GyrI-like domain-containing protein [Calditrichota bacterium]